MTPELHREIRQSKPFDTAMQEAFLNLSRTESELLDSFEAMLKPYGISATQYNVLRILRGGPTEGHCRNEVADRLVSRMPDVTRLLDRMEDAGLVKRVRSEEDRREVYTQLTAKGRDLVDKLDGPSLEEHRQRLGHLSATELRTLIDLLTRIREGK